MNYLPDEQRKTAQKKKQKLRENKGTKNEMAEAEKRMSMYAQGQARGQRGHDDGQRTRTKAQGNFFCGFIIKRTK